MKNKKLSSVFILTLLSFIFSITFILIVLVTKNIRNSHILHAVVFIILIILYSFIIFLLFVYPLQDIKQVTSNLNDNYYAFYCKYGTTKEIEDLMNEINRLGDHSKLVYNKYLEVTSINQSFHDQYKQDIEYRKTFLASLSHEIKTPLTVISNYAEAILDDIYTNKDEIKEAVSAIIEQANKTNQMLYTISSMYKLESSKIDLEKEDINLLHFIDDILLDLKPLIIKYNQKIEYLSSLDYNFRGNVALLERAFKCIIVNAITYSPKGQKITFELIDNPNYKVLEIINYGIIIARDDLNKIFEPFYRVDKARAQQQDKGTGLGLHIAKETFDRHDLDYGITNVANGVKFYIIFKK